jgi:limonene-1,2-epoxide hydrolase
MSDEPTSPVEVVRAFLSAMEALDYDTGLRHVADDVEYVNMPMGPVTGPAGIRSVLEPFFGSTISNEFVIRTIVSDGPVVIVERLDRHQFPKGWAELPVTGVFEVHEGLITSWREYFDLATIERGIAETL